MDEKKTENPKSQEPSWKYRRRVIFGTLLFCALTIGYVLWNGDDTKIGETAITMAFITASSVVGGYVFGATYETIKRK